MDAVDIVAVDPGSSLATGLLKRYYVELDARLTGGFDVAMTVAAPEAELVAPYGAFLVAYVDREPVGCGAVRRLDEATGEIKRMWVDPAARGRGVGRRVLVALEDAGRQLGFGRVRLDTSADLGEALTLYRTGGYVDIPAYNDNPYAAHWLEKRLA